VALRAELAKAKLDTRSETVAIDLMRAAGPVLPKIEGAADALAALWAKDRSPRARFLLQAPAADLARAGDKRAEDYVREALRKDEDPHVRARAAAVAAGVPGLAEDLAAAVDDAEPRVREAAVAAVADAGEHGEPVKGSGLTAALGRRLSADDWTFVRAGAARALGAMPADPAVDAALAAALKDKSVDVRERVLDGLGTHRALAHIEAIRERQDDEEENVEVRARAIIALGVMCDAKSVDMWTKLARGARQPMDDRDRRLGGAAIAALGELRPADLEARIGPIADKDAPLGLREMVKAALSSSGSCKK
jgi:HEAT repeat protein